MVSRSPDLVARKEKTCQDYERSPYMDYICSPKIMAEPTPQPDSDTPRISDAEWSVMRSLWRQGETRAGRIIADLTERTDWKPKTIQTLIRRLVQKGLITYEQSGRERLYRAAFSEQECQLQASKNFLERVFGGELAPFLANFAGRGRSLTKADIAELKKLLEESEDDE